MFPLRPPYRVGLVPYLNSMIPHLSSSRGRCRSEVSLLPFLGYTDIRVLGRFLVLPEECFKGPRLGSVSMCRTGLSPVGSTPSFQNGDRK